MEVMPVSSRITRDRIRRREYIQIIATLLELSALEHVCFADCDNRLEIPESSTSYIKGDASVVERRATSKQSHNLSS